MVKLAQQFNAAGIKSKAVTGLGWSYPAQRAYVRGRFDNLRPFTCPIYNHKKEQILRALVVAVEDGKFESLTSVGTPTASLHYNAHPDNTFRIGKVKGRGAVLFPETNAALAILGLNANAVLHWLGGIRIVDELTGFKHEVIANDGEYIYSTLGVLQRLAHDCVHKRTEILFNYQADKRVRKAK